MADTKTPGVGERQTVSDLSQSLQIGISQLSAMLAVTYGSDNFRELSDHVQDHFLWGLHDKAESLLRMSESLCSSLVGSDVEVRHG